MYVNNFEDAVPIGIGAALAPHFVQGLVKWLGVDRSFQVLANYGTFYCMKKFASKQFETSEILSKVAREAFNYYLLGNLVWNVEYLVEPILSGAEESFVGKAALTALFVTRAAFFVFGGAQVGKIILRHKLQKQCIKEVYGNLAERVAETSKQTLLNLVLLNSVSTIAPEMSGAVDLLKSLCIATTVSQVLQYSLEYVLKTKWARREESTREWQQGYQDRILAEKISKSAALILFSGIASYSISQYVPALKWPAIMISGLSALSNGWSIVSPGYLRIYKNWFHENRVVQLAAKNGILQNRVYDRETGRFLKEHFFALYDSPTNRSEILSKCTIFDPVEGPYAKLPLAVWKGDYEVSLLKIKNRFIVSVEYSNGEVGYSRFSVRKKYRKFHLSEESELELDSVLRQIEESDPRTIKKLERSIMPIEICRNKETQLEGSIPITQKVVFIMNSARSWIDSRFSVSKNCWGVTLIRMGGPLDQHTTIIFEGLENGEYLMFAAELNNEKHILYKKVEPKLKKQQSTPRYSAISSDHVSSSKRGPAERFDFRPSDLRWKARTCVFKVSKKQLVPLFNEILSDINAARLKDEKSPSNFSFLGNKSIKHKFSSQRAVRKDSCFTWARCKVSKIGIMIGESDLDYLATVPGLYMHGERDFRDTPFPDENWLRQQQYGRHEL